MIESQIKFAVQTKVLPTKGQLVYEYNPFRNYRCTQTMFEYKGDYYTQDQLKERFDIEPSYDKQSWLQNGEVNDDLKNDITLYEKGQLIDFITDELNFDIEHPVDIVPQYSYDGSVNLILNDGINPPRLINSRFSATGRNTYEVIDRKGNNDTNIYDQGEQFNIDTSLYKRVTSIPKLSFEGTSSGGNLFVGNYHFYFKLSDADGNETDFVAESGLVSVFIGFGSPDSITTGTKNENSYKGVDFTMSNIDPSYDYLYVYYSRSTAEGSENFNTEYKKIDKKFTVNNAGVSNIHINGYEPTIAITAQDINLNYSIVDAAKAQTQCQNMLFLGNVHKPEIPYEELSDLSLHFCPYLNNKDYDCRMDQTYNITTSSLGYTDSQYIYNYVGYWDKEYYRLGVVYILANGELSPVFNIRGCSNMQPYSYSFKYSNLPVWKDDEQTKRSYINYNETSFLIIKEKSNNASDENVKGVIKIQSSEDTNKIHGLDIRIDNDAIAEIKKYAKGFFFVRQNRIPTILAQGITIGIDQNSYTPTIPTAGGLLDTLKDSLDGTHVTTEDINDVNYISEGFLSRYSFKFKRKSSSLWSKIGKIGLITAAVVGLAAATVFTAGAAGAVVAGASVAGAVTAGTSAIGSVMVAAGAVTTGLGLSLGVAGSTAVIAVSAGVAASAITAAVASVQTAKYEIQSWEKKKLDGRNTKCPSGYKLEETDESRQLNHDFIERIIIKDSTKNKVQAIICPDYELNQPYYNQIFTGNEHLIESTLSQGTNLLMGHSSNYFTEDTLNNNRHYYIPDYYDNTSTSVQGTYKIIAVPDNVKCVGLDNIKFRSRAGEAEEAWRYECVGDDYKSDYTKQNSEEDDETISNKKINSDIVRGSYGAYLGVNNTGNKLSPATTVNIYIPKYSTGNNSKYMQIRMDDASAYYAITDRIDIKDLDDYLVVPKSSLFQQQYFHKGYKFSAFRGDCYICQVTHRINRNFQDPSAPYNDDIVDENSWKDNYNPEKTEDYENINLGDVNAIQLGMWVTFRIRSSYNLNIRTLDSSNVDEKQMTGHARGYYPYYPMSTEGTYKIPESEVYNKGFSKSVSERWNNLLPDVPYIKNWFGTRIMYSDIHINDAYKNGYRVFQGTHHRDYTREYGEIVKLVSLESNLLVVFEHGIGLLEVNQQMLTQQNGQYINTSNVLPEKPKIISDMFGSQWADSILKTPGKRGDSIQYVYGVDTVAKKIWRTDGNLLECISDFKVQEFLNNNVSLGEREITPKLGVRNVKTCYNAYKRDVLFTFYDNTYGFQEKVWNLCWNEILQKFITFYSWVPSFMENINNIPFSFNRDTSKWIAKLGVSHSNNSFADGITLTNTVFDTLKSPDNFVDTYKVPITYTTTQGLQKTTYKTVENTTYYIGALSLSNRTLPTQELYYTISYELVRDIYKNYKWFEIKPLTFLEGNEYPSDAKYSGKSLNIYGLFLKDRTKEEVLNQGEGAYENARLNDETFTYTLDGGVYGDVYYREGKLGNTYLVDKTKVSIHAFQDYTILSELYYRNSAGHSYADWDTYKVAPGENYSTPTEGLTEIYYKDNSNFEEVLLGDETNAYSLGYTDTNVTGEIIHTSLPIFKNKAGQRKVLPEKLQINADKIVRLLNIRATISVETPNESKATDAYYNYIAGYNSNTTLVNYGQYESTIAVTPKWNMQFLSTDFWKHGQAGIIDIADDIYPTYWYGKQHPFEFEVVVVNDPAVHKIFNNLELVANKAKPESFHYEIVGESYDFAKDKANMYFRQEALKALWQYNGCDIEYNNNFLKIQPKQQPKSADLLHTYYARQDRINEVYDSYVAAEVGTHDYRHLSGAEIVYYPFRQEYRVWNHALAVDLDDQQDTTESTYGGRGLIASNMRYIEDRWRIQINPLNIVYKNEYTRRYSGSLFTDANSTWTYAADGITRLPKLSIYNSPIPSYILLKGEIEFPDTNTGEGSNNALYGLYSNNYSYIDDSNWLNDNIYKTSFGSAQNRKEADIRDKFVKIRIRYSGDELAIIDYLNTIYQVSYI